MAVQHLIFGSWARRRWWPRFIIWLVVDIRLQGSIDFRSLTIAVVLMVTLGLFANPTLNIQLTFLWFSERLNYGSNWESNTVVMYYETGIIECGLKDGELVSGVLASAAQHNLDLEYLSVSQARIAGLFGSLNTTPLSTNSVPDFLVEQCVSAHVEFAQWAGAETFCDQTFWR